MKRAHALVLIGPMGAGKSVVGARVAQRLGWRFVDTDAQVEQHRGMSIADLFASEGEPAFRAAESAALTEALGAGDVVVATGGGAVLDAVNRALMSHAGFVVHLHADPAAQCARLQADTSRPLLAVADREARLRELADARGPLYAEIADLRVDTGRLGPDEVADVVCDAVKARA